MEDKKKYDYYSKEKVEELSQYDFFACGSIPKIEQKDIKTVKICGNHKTEAPFVTIIITTYKRSSTLKYALESAINQVGFDDYEIIISDNSGAMVGEVSETEKLIRGYTNEKIIYYRHENTIEFGRISRPVYLAKSNWICIIHDDDCLVENHLKVMCDILKKHTKIKYLGCKLKIFKTRESEIEDFLRLTIPYRGAYKVEYMDAISYQAGFVGDWLGALINRNLFIKEGHLGGKLSTQINDYVMGAKFAYLHGTYICTAPLYCYRIWGNQESSNVVGVTNACISTYILQKYIVTKTRILLKPIFYKFCKYNALRNLITKKTDWKLNVDQERFKEVCGITDVNVADWQYRYYINGITLYLKIRHNLRNIRCIRGEVE